MSSSDISRVGQSGASAPPRDATGVTSSDKAGSPLPVPTPAQTKSAVARAPRQPSAARALEAKTATAASNPSESRDDGRVLDSDGKRGEAILSMGEKRRALGDAGLPAQDFKRTLSELVTLDVPFDLRDERDAAAKKGMNAAVSAVLVSSTRGVDTFSGEGLRIATAATEAHGNAILSIETMASSRDPAVVRAACETAEKSVRDMIPLATGADDREKLEAVAACVRAMGESRAAGLESLAENRPAIEMGLTSMTSPGGTGNPVEAMKTTAASLRAVSEAATPRTPDGTPAPNGMALTRQEGLEELLERFADGAEAVKDALVRKHLDNDAEALVKLTELEANIAASVDLIETHLGGEMAAEFSALGRGAGLIAKNLENNVGAANEYIAALNEYRRQIRQGQFEKLPEAKALLDTPPLGAVPSALKKGIDEARELFANTLSDRAATVRGEIVGKAERLVSGDLAEACAEINKLLDNPLVDDATRGAVADIIGRALRTRNEESLEQVIGLVNELNELMANPDMQSSAMRTRIAAGLDRLERSIGELSTRLDGEIEALEKDAGVAATTGGKADEIQSTLHSVRERLAETKADNLAKLRSSLALMRFNNSIGNKISPEVMLNKGAQGLARILRHSRLEEAALEALRGKLEGAGSLDKGDRRTLRRELANVLTRKQRGNEPLKTALDRLENGEALDANHLAALRRASLFILSSEQAGLLQADLKKASAENLAAMNDMAESLRAKIDNEDTRASALTDFARNRRILERQARAVLLRDDYRTFTATMRGMVKANAPKLAALCHERAVQGLRLSEEKKTQIRAVADSSEFQDLLIAAGGDPRLGVIILSTDDPRETLALINSPETAEATIDALLFDRPELDDLCLRLKLRKAGDSSDQTARQIGERHEGDRLVRECQSLLRKQVLISPRAREARDEVVNLPPAEFIARCLGGMGVAEDMDLFILNAYWLRCRADLPDPVADDAFAEFQSRLPAPYAARAELRNELESGLSSTSRSDKMNSFLSSESSRFNRSGFRHKALELVGNLTSNVLTDSERVDRMLYAMASPPHHHAASVVRNRIIANQLNLSATSSVEVDRNNVGLMMPRGKKVRLSFADGIKRLFHLKSWKDTFSDLSSQIANAGRRGFQTTGETAENLRRNSERMEALTLRYAPILECMQEEIRATGNEEWRAGEFLKNGGGLAMAVIGIDTAVNGTDAGLGGWNERRALLKSVSLPGKFNLLGMGQKKATPAAQEIGKQFKTALENAANAKSEDVYNANVEVLRQIIAKHNLTGRAEATLAFKQATNKGMDTKAGKALGKSFSNPTLRSIVEKRCEGVYLSAAKIQSSTEAILKAANGRAPANPPEYYLSAPVIAAFEEIARACLLDAFTKQTSPVDFAGYVTDIAKGEADFESTAKMIADAVGGDDPEAALNVAKHFLAKEAEKYLRAKGGPVAELERQEAAVADPQNFKAIKDKDSAAAVRAGLRRLPLRDVVTNLSKGAMLSMNTSLGVTLSTDGQLPVDALEMEFSLELAIQHGISLERGADNTLSLYLSRGMTAGIGVGVSALAEIASAEAKVEGSLVFGYKLDFASDAQCLDFMDAMLQGSDVSRLRSLSTGVTVVDEQSIKASLEAKLEIGEKVDKAAVAVTALRHGIGEAVTGTTDHRRIVDAELGAQAQAKFTRTGQRHGIETKRTLELYASAGVSASASLGIDGEHGKAEKSAEAAFRAGLECDFRAGTLTGATMTRSYTIEEGASREDVAAILASYGLANEHAVGFVMARIASGQDVTLHIDADLTAGGLEKATRDGGTSAIGNFVALCDRDNYAATAIRVEVRDASVSSSATVYEKEAAESEDDEEQDDSGTESGLLDDISAKFTATSDGGVTATHGFFPTPVSRVAVGAP